MPLDQGACIYGAGVLLKYLQALEEETTAVHAGAKDIEYLHRARVASRRLRASLPLFSSCLPQKKLRGWEKQIRGVTRALGEARDADVQIERVREFAGLGLPPQQQPGVYRLLLRLWQKRQRLDAPITAAMQDMLQSGMIASMRKPLKKLTTRADQVYLYTPALYQHSFDSITAQLDGLLQYRQAVLQEENVAELHAMRIEAKHLRYTIETFAPIYGSGLRTHLNAIRAIQEQLGNIHDCDVWIAWLPVFLQEEEQRVIDFTGRAASFRRVVEGVAAFRDNRLTARQSAYQEFLTSWQAWEAAALWEELPRALQTPFPIPGQIYPPLSASS